jgi:UDP-GlcNAc:undecaprenyl-phosphate GlcNAc-1-phosphate transferase
MLVATRSFGHAEFELLKKRLVHKFSGAQANGGPRYLEVRIQGKADWSSLGHDLAAQAEELGLISLCLDINAPALHEAYLGRWERGGDQPEDHSIWRTQIPLSAAGHSLGRLDIVGRGSGQSTSSKIAILAGLVEDLEFGLGNIIRRARVHTSPVAANGRSPLSIFAVNGEHVAASVGTQTALYEEANGETYLDSELGNGDLSSSRKPR